MDIIDRRCRSPYAVPKNIYHVCTEGCFILEYKEPLVNDLDQVRVSCTKCELNLEISILNTESIVYSDNLLIEDLEI